MKICCALISYPTSPLFGKACGCIAAYTTNENLQVCKRHVRYLKNDDSRIKKLYEEHKATIEKQKNVISKKNEELLAKNPGKIPLKNKEGYIIDFVSVSKQDYNSVIKYSWSKYKNGDSGEYALGIVDGKTTRMHHLILGKPEEDYVVDHKV